MDGQSITELTHCGGNRSIWWKPMQT